MTALEKRAAVSLAGIFSMRMLGMFMIFPIFSLYIDELEHATPELMGFAIGVYGLTQGLLQIPFGLLSDRIGRKPVIFMGLVLFAAGSVVAATSVSIYGVIFGRALQGSGAIAAAVMALAADLTREEHRTKAMAVIGMSIGASFALALVLGPVLDHWVGLHGIFWLTAILACLGMGILWWLVPTPALVRQHRDAEPVPAQFRRVLRDTQLLRLDAGILLLHMILTASFIALPLVLEQGFHMPSLHHWWVYLPILLLSIAGMVPFIILAERHRRMKKVFLGAILCIGLAQAVLALSQQSFVVLLLGLLLFFTAFNLLEASLPSLVSKVAPPDCKGTAMGFYSSSQFIGAALGGSLAGQVLASEGTTGIFWMCAGLALLWFLVAAGMRAPRYLSSYLLNVGVLNESEASHLALELTRIRGVAEAVVIARDEVAYLKVDRKALDEAALLRYSRSPAADFE